MFSFKPGDEVVCVRVKSVVYPATARKDVGDIIIPGTIYVIRWVGLCVFMQPDGSSKEEIALRLVDFNRCTQAVNKHGDITLDVPYAHWNFRPIQKTIVSAAMEIFRKIAANPKIKIAEKA